MRAIDLFAGLGGNTQGYTMTGGTVVWAANHWRLAVDYHTVNHPGTQHLCQDLRQADWSRIPPFDFGMASPCCQGHSWARGTDKASHDASRATAWAAVDCFEYHRPRAFFIENVPEFRNWLLYPNWSSALASLGYHLTTVISDAADHGVPQNRKRLFIVGVKGKKIPIKLPRRPHKPAVEIIDLNAGTWSPIERAGRAKSTLRRVKRGRAEFGDVFVMPYYGDGSGLTGRSIHRPIGTITTVDRWAIVRGNEMRMLSVDEYRQAMGFPAGTALPPRKSDAVRLLGNATCPPQIADLVAEVQARF